MAILQKKLFYKTKFTAEKISSMKKGFISILLIPFVALMMTAVFGLFSLSVGIKNITRVQSYCIQSNLKGQKELAVLLTQLLRMNKKVKTLSKTRAALNTALLASMATGQVHIVLKLKKKIELIKKAQSFIVLKQNKILVQSSIIKRNTFRHFKSKLKTLPVSYVHKKNFYGSALAVQRHKLGDRAFIYKPVPDFINHQKTNFSWRLRSFSPLENLLKLSADSQYSQQSCTASLKQKGKKWISTLYH